MAEIPSASSTHCLNCCSNAITKDMVCLQNIELCRQIKHHPGAWGPLAIGWGSPSTSSSSHGLGLPQALPLLRPTAAVHHHWHPPRAGTLRLQVLLASHTVSHLPNTSFVGIGWGQPDSLAPPCCPTSTAHHHRQSPRAGGLRHHKILRYHSSTTKQRLTVLHNNKLRLQSEAASKSMCRSAVKFSVDTGGSEDDL